jgi:hypothetical protein
VVNLAFTSLFTLPFFPSRMLQLPKKSRKLILLAFSLNLLELSSVPMTVLRIGLLRHLKVGLRLLGPRLQMLRLICNLGGVEDQDT